MKMICMGWTLFHSNANGKLTKNGLAFNNVISFRAECSLSEKQHANAIMRQIGYLTIEFNAVVLPRRFSPHTKQISEHLISKFSNDIRFKIKYLGLLNHLNGNWHWKMDKMRWISENRQVIVSNWSVIHTHAIRINFNHTICQFAVKISMFFFFALHEFSDSQEVPTHKHTHTHFRLPIHTQRERHWEKEAVYVQSSVGRLNYSNVIPHTLKIVSILCKHSVHSLAAVDVVVHRWIVFCCWFYSNSSGAVVIVVVVVVVAVVVVVVSFIQTSSPISSCISNVV